MTGPVRVSALAVLSLLLSAGTSLLAVLLFWGAGMVQAVEASSLSDLVARETVVYHPTVSWAAVLLGGGAQILALVLALWSRRRIRHSGGRLVGGGVAIVTIVIAAVTLALSPGAFACGAALAG